MRRSAPAGRGFTLLELTVAVAIAAVAVGVVIVRLEGWTPRQALRAEALRLGNTIRTYRGLAQVEERDYILAIDLEKGTYEIRTEIAGGRAEIVRRGEISEKRRFEKVTSGGQDLPSPVTIVFDPRGILPETSIRISDDGGTHVDLVIATFFNEIDYKASSE